MAIPTVVGVGSIASSAGSIAASAPTGLQVDDVCYLHIESEGTEAAPTLSGDSGFGTWTKVVDQADTAGGAGGTRQTIYRAVVTSTPVTAPTISDPGNHTSSRMIAVRGADTSDPNETITTGGDTTSDTSGTMPSHTTSGADRLVLLAAVSNLPDATGTTEYTWDSFGNLANGTEQSDNRHAAGSGGSHSWASGELASAGSIGTVSYTKVNAGVKLHSVIAVKPAASGTNHSVPIDDTLSLADSITPARGINLSVDDSASIGDSLGSEAAFLRSVADTAGLSDVLVRAAEYFRTVDDTVGLADQITAGLAFAQTVDDLLNIADSVLRAVGYARTVDDAVGVADSIDPVLSAGPQDHSVPINDSVAVTDVIALDYTNVALAQLMDRMWRFTRRRDARRTFGR